MKRRKFLAVGGLGLGVGGGYMGWNWYYSPKLPDGMNVETLHLERDILTPEAARDSESLAWQEEYRAIIDEEDTASNNLIEENDLNEFVKNTNFNESYLILVQNGMQSQPDLVLDAIERTEAGLHLNVSIDSPLFGVNDDLITHSLLIRTTGDENGTPEAITLDIDGYV